jgi:hypothetical protein
MSNRPVVLLAYIDLRNLEPLKKTAAALGAEYPGAEIICLNNPETRQAESQVREVSRWLTIPGAKGLGLLWELRLMRPAAVAVQYNADFPHAHLKLELLAALLGGRPLGAFPADYAGLKVMSRAGLYGRIAGKKLLLFLRCGAAAALAGFAGLVLLFSDLLAKPGERLGAPAAGKPR